MTLSTKFNLLKLTESSRLHLLLQLMYRAGQHDETLVLLQQLRKPHLDGFTKSNVVQIAKIAFKCGDDITARQLLPRDLTGLGEVVWLEEGLEIATELEDDELIERYDAQLAALFPNSERLRENRDRRLLLDCREVSVHRGHVFTTAGFSDRHLKIQDAITMSSPLFMTKSSKERRSGTGSGWNLRPSVVLCTHGRLTRTWLQSRKAVSSLCRLSTDAKLRRLSCRPRVH